MREPPPDLTSQDELDRLIREAGYTWVSPAREDPELLERVRDPRLLARAAELLGSRDRDTRHRAILCIGRIGYALGDQQTAEILLRHASHAKTRDDAESALHALKACAPPRPLPAEPLRALARRREWQVWHETVQCLHLGQPEEVEPALLEQLDSDRYGAVHVARELRFMTSQASLDALESLLDYANLDVRAVALGSLGERLGKGVLPYARRLMAGRTRQEKWFAEEWLALHGEAEDVPLMAGRLKQLLTGKRTRTYLPTEVSYIVPFLLRFRELPETEAALARLRSDADRLPKDELEWVEANAPELLVPD